MAASPSLNSVNARRNSMYKRDISETSPFFPAASMAAAIAWHRVAPKLPNDDFMEWA
jgi:hypothetical protein